jgi:hypothetical protein
MKFSEYKKDRIEILVKIGLSSQYSDSLLNEVATLSMAQLGLDLLNSLPADKKSEVSGKLLDQPFNANVYEDVELPNELVLDLDVRLLEYLKSFSEKITDTIEHAKVESIISEFTNSFK